jgi:hypothetical protein
MTKEDYRLLELLLGKLGIEIGMFCIIPGYLHDGYNIGIFNGQSGAPVKSATGATIEATVENLKLQPTNHDKD